MASNEHLIKEANNFIGQKLFTYIYDGNQLNQTIKDKFKKSLIFLGYEGQIYNPLTNTYVGIGTTSYKATLKYISDVDDKVDALNQALTSSMVSAIYANFDEKDLTDLFKGKLNTYGYIPSNSDNVTVDSLTKNLYATNELVIRGAGDYDASTGYMGGADLKQRLNINNANLTNEEQQILSNSYIVRSDIDNPFATNGITVSMERGLNRYRFNFASLYDNDVHAVNGMPDKLFIEPAAVSNLGEVFDNDRKHTKEPASKLLADHGVIVNDGEYALNTDSEEYKLAIEAIATYWCKVKNIDLAGKTTYLEAYEAAGNTAPKIYDYFVPAVDSENNQLYKNGKNVMLIDDKLTWSYISSSNAYIMDFAKSFTTNEVNRIYAEILGLDSKEAIIPVDASTIKKVVNDNEHFAFDENSKTFVPSSYDTDGMLLYKTILDESTIYFKKVYYNTDLYAAKVSLTYKFSGKEGENIEYFKELSSSIPVLSADNIVSYVTSAPNNNQASEFKLFYSKSLVTGSTYVTAKVDTMKSWEAACDLTKDNLAANANNIFQGPTVMTANYDGIETDNVSYYDNGYFLIPVDSLDDINENHEYVVINKFNSSSDNINLTDGINTLKEAAYILDWITNGAMDPQNPEASGIEMAYTIAQNHIDIEKLNERLKAVEGGTNVVNCISSADKTNKYVTLNWESSTRYALVSDSNSAYVAVGGYSYGTTFDEPTYVSAPGASGPIATKDLKNVEFFYFNGTSYQAMLDSQVLEWNRLVAVYNNDKDHSYVTGVTTPMPELSAIVGEACDGIISYSRIDDKMDGKDGKPKAFGYVGQVSLDVDLDVASTYTLHQYGHMSATDGFIPVTINDANIVKAATVEIVLPQKISTFNSIDILGFANDSSVDRYTSNEITNGFDLNANTQVKINNILQNVLFCNSVFAADADIEIPAGGVLDKIGEDPIKVNDGKLAVTIKFSVNTDSAIGQPVLNKVEFKLTSVDNGTYDGKLYTAAVADEANEVKTNDAINANQVYYLRYKATDNNVKFAYMSDSLASTDWVQAYTYHAIKALDGALVKSAVDAYNYTNLAVSRLDSEVQTVAGKYISGIKIENGNVSVTTTELPKDKISVNTVVWGNDGVGKTFTEIPETQVDGKHAIEVAVANAGESPIYAKVSGAPQVDAAGNYKNTYINDYEYVLATVADFEGSNALTYTYAFTLDADGKFVQYKNVFGAQDGKIASTFENSKPLADGSHLSYVDYKPIYKQVDKYIKIDAADIVVDSDGKYSYMIDEGSGSYSLYEKLYTCKYNSSAYSSQYLSASIAQSTTYFGGKGENTISLTAHITKISDATENNTGFADANDVRETLSSMFEWVDLSEWVNAENPVNMKGNRGNDVPTEAPTAPAQG